MALSMRSFEMSAMQALESLEWVAVKQASEAAKEESGGAVSGCLAPLKRAAMEWITTAMAL